MRVCSRCGNPLPLHSGRGRPRKLCSVCSPPRGGRVPSPVVEATSGPARSVVEATRALLVSEGVVGTPMGRSALVLAERIDDRDQPLAAVSQAVRQLREALASVVAGERVDTGDPSDEFTRKRRARESGA